MADTKRVLSALQTLFADNVVKAITPQGLRDFLVSVMGSRRVRTMTTTGAVDDDDDVIIVDATAGAVTVNLPAVSGRANKVYTIIKKDNVNNVVIDANASELISGATTQTLSTQYARYSIICDGVAWFILGS